MKWSPVDVVVAVLVFIVVWFLVLQSAVGILKGIPMDAQRTEIAGNLIAAIFSVITLYVGAKLNKNKPDDKP